MNTIILAAGMSKRMGNLTNDKNKSMIEINETSLIVRMIRILIKNKINEITIVTGYKEKELKEHVNKNMKDINDIKIQYINNIDYKKTNNIYSLYLAKDILNNTDSLIIEADLIFEESMIHKILNAKEKNVALVAKYQDYMDGTLVNVEKSQITEFIEKENKKYRQIQKENYYKTINIYKLSKEFSENCFVPALEKLINDKKVNEYYERVFQTIIKNPNVILNPLEVENEKWYEVDTIQDLKIAQMIFREKKSFEKIQKSFGGYWRDKNIKDFCYLNNPFFDITNICKNIQTNLKDLLESYPSSLSYQNDTVATLFDINRENIVVGNGASELINVLGKIIRGKMLVNVPTFNEYIRCFNACKIVKNDISKTDYRLDINSILKMTEKVDVMCLISPDNPTGNIIEFKDMIQLLDKAKQKNVKVIIDESFMDFATEDMKYTLINQEILEKYTNLIVINSMSKTYNIAGMRLGVLATGNMDLMVQIKKELPIWNINSISEVFLEIVQQYGKEYEKACQDLIKERNRLYKELTKINYIEVYESQSNFIMCRLNKENSSNIAKYLFENYNIFIKDLKDKEGFENKDYIRVAIKSREDNNLLIGALKSYEP